MSTTESRSRPGAPGRTAALALALGLVTAAAWGCEGRHVWAPVTRPPTILEFSGPAQVAEGASIPITARAVGLVRVDSFVVEATGAVTGRQVQTNTAPDADVTFNFTFTAPSPTPSTVASFSGFAVDAQGNASEIVSLLVSIPDQTPPQIGKSLSATSVPQGGQLRVEVQASDVSGLQNFGARIFGPAGNEVFSQSLGSTDNAASGTFTWNVPAQPVFGAYEVEAFARDLGGNAVTTPRETVQVIDTLDPTIMLLEPDSTLPVTPDEPLFVRVRVADNDAVQQVVIRSIAFRGDPDLGTGFSVEPFQPWTIDLGGALPADTTLTRFMAPATNAAQQVQPGETFRLIIETRDRSQNVTSRTVFMRGEGGDEGDGDG
jgi:hypothetical protein